MTEAANNRQHGPIEENDPVEAELHTLQPREVSPELRHRIAAGLALPTTLRLRRRWRGAVWGALLAGGVAAACLAAAILLRREGDDQITVDPEPVAETLRPLLATAYDDSLPTVWTYRRALAGSADELDAALDRHTGPVAEPASPLAHVRAFIRAEARASLPGEL